MKIAIQLGVVDNEGEVDNNSLHRLLIAHDCEPAELLRQLTVKELRKLLRVLQGRPGQQNKKSLIRAILEAAPHQEFEIPWGRFAARPLDPGQRRRAIDLDREMNRAYRDRDRLLDWLSYTARDYFPDKDVLSPEERRDIARAVLAVVEDDLDAEVSPIEVALLWPYRRALLAVEGADLAPAGVPLRRGGDQPRYSPRYGFVPNLVEVSSDQDRGIPIVYEPDAVVVRYIFALAATGATTTEIADRLEAHGFSKRPGKHWLRQELLPILRDRAYVGYYGGGVAVEPIIGESTFHRVQEVLTLNAPGQEGFSGRSFRLADRLHCMRCGEHLVRSTGKGGKYAYYRCPSDDSCETKQVQTQRLESAILSSLVPELLVNRLRPLLAALGSSAPGDVTDDHLDHAFGVLEPLLNDAGTGLAVSLAHLHIRRVEVETGPGHCAAAHIYLSKTEPSVELRDGSTSGPWTKPPSERRTLARRRKRASKPKRWRVYQSEKAISLPLTDAGLAQVRRWAEQGQYHLFVDGIPNYRGRYPGLVRDDDGEVRRVGLTVAEVNLLCLLARNAGTTVSVERLCEALGGDSRSMRNLVRRVRRKVDHRLDVPGRPAHSLIVTAPSGRSGYLIKHPSLYRYRIVIPAPVEECSSGAHT